MSLLTNFYEEEEERFKRMWHGWQDTFAHPDSPAGGGGPGSFREPGPLGMHDTHSHRYPHPQSPEGLRHTHSNPAHYVRPHFMKSSQQGLEFIFSIEVGPLKRIAAHLYWPGGASGVTLGSGYDMKLRKKEDVVNDLTAIGVPKKAAESASEGVGLHGAAAKDFARHNERLISLSDEQQIKLLRQVVPAYERIVNRHNRMSLAQHEFDALVCFAYNPGGSFIPIAHAINTRHLELAAGLMRMRVFSGGKKLAALVYRRERETGLLLKGVYR